MSLFKVISFIKKDFIIESTYKLNFILTFFNSTFPVISIFFIGKLVENTESLSLAKYGGDYFPFALIGIAVTRFFQLAIDTFSGNIKRAQMAGCLEAILSSQTEPKTIVIMSSFYSFLSAGIQLIFMFLIGFLLFGFNLSNANIPAAILSIIVSMPTFISLGIFSAAGTIIFKQGEPIGWLFGVLSALLGGAMFPISIMPNWLQYTSHIFPITYTLDALRLSTLRNYSIIMLNEQLLALGIMSIILFPLSLKFFEWAVERGKKDGSLMHY